MRTFGPKSGAGPGGVEPAPHPGLVVHDSGQVPVLPPLPELLPELEPLLEPLLLPLLFPELLPELEPPLLPPPLAGVNVHSWFVSPA